MASHSILMTILFLLAVIVASPATAALATVPDGTAASPAAAPTANSTTPTAYDMLEQYNLARGILPEGVTGYVLHPDGSFEVYLPEDCNLHVGGLNVRYSSIIKGSIHSQSIRDVQGVSVKVTFVWIGITEVDASDDQLHFVAGPISKSFPVDKFSNSPQCN